MSYQNQPIGTIIASLLEYDELCIMTGENHTIINNKSTYVPCDGRSIIGSRLSTTGMTNAPDLRGRFLRGLNVMHNHGEIPVLDLATADPNGEDRRVGSYQGDEFKSHSHKYNDSYAGPQSGYGDNGRPGSNPGQDTSFTGGAETRPRNVAVYYYVRIN